MEGISQVSACVRQMESKCLTEFLLTGNVLYFTISDKHDENNISNQSDIPAVILLDQFSKQKQKITESVCACVCVCWGREQGVYCQSSDNIDCSHFVTSFCEPLSLPYRCHTALKHVQCNHQIQVAFYCCLVGAFSLSLFGVICQSLGLVCVCGLLVTLKAFWRSSVCMIQ